MKRNDQTQHEIRPSRMAAGQRGNWTSRRWLALSFLTVFFGSNASLCAQYTISPVAGAAGYQFDGTGVAVDSAGNVYATAIGTTAWSGPYIMKVSPSEGAPTVLAGSDIKGGSPYSICNDGPGPTTTVPTNIGFTDLGGVAVDPYGNVYVSQSGNGPIVEIESSSFFTCPVGSNEYGAIGIAADSAGDIFFVDSATAIYKGAEPILPISGSCSNGEIGSPVGLAVDAAGNLYIADQRCNVIWKVTQLGTGQRTVVAGTYQEGNCPASVGDGALATKACLDAPIGVAVDPYGNLYIADFNNFRVREVNNQTKIITTIAGNGTSGSTTAGPATSTSLQPHSITIGPGGEIYVGVLANSSTNLMYKLTPTGAMMVSPAPGSTMRPPVTFTWSGAPAGSEYQLDFGNNPIVPGTSYTGDIYDSGATSATESTPGSFPCNGDALNAQLTTTTAGVSQSGVYTYKACMLDMTVSPTSLGRSGGVVTVTVTVWSQLSQDVTLTVTGAQVYPCPPNPFHPGCPAAVNLNGSPKSLTLVANQPQTVSFTVTFNATPPNLNSINIDYEFSATLTGANGSTLDSVAVVITAQS
jgi:trimeric autotransporter adhesin